MRILRFNGWSSSRNLAARYILFLSTERYPNLQGESMLKHLLKRSLILGVSSVMACAITGIQANAQGGGLITAAGKGDLVQVTALLNAKTDVNVKNYRGETALMVAAKNNHLDVVWVLLDAKADVDAKMSNVKASWDKLTRWGAPSEAPGYTALMLASNQGYLGIVRALLDAGVDVNAKSADGYTALMAASRSNHLEVVRALLEAKADVDSKMSNYDAPDEEPGIDTNGEKTALMLASEAGNLNVVRTLLDAGADVNAGGIYCGTALILAVKNDHLEVVRTLLAAKANVNAVMKNDSDESDPWSYTAVFWAAYMSDVKVMQVLLAAKPDLNVACSDGKTALIEASEKGNLEIVRMLLAAKADVNSSNNFGYTALMMASDNGQFEVVQALLAAKVNVNAKMKKENMKNGEWNDNSAGTTALMLASKSGCTDNGCMVGDYIDVVQALLAAGADVNAKRDDGYTALGLALKFGQSEVAQILKQAGAVDHKG
ncbi:MAG: ankyrin repeat domain-containing protein [Terracidiphilus sp.]